MAFGTTPTNGTEYALWNASPPRKVKGRLWGDNGQYYGSNVAETKAAGGQINLIQLQVGQIVLGGHMAWAALGAGTQFSVGDAVSCNRYKTAANGAVASINQVSSIGDCTLLNNPAGMGYTVTSTTTDVILTFSYAAASGALSAGDIKLLIEVG